MSTGIPTLSEPRCEWSRNLGAKGAGTLVRMEPEPRGGGIAKVKDQLGEACAELKNARSGELDAKREADAVRSKLGMARYEATKVKDQLGEACVLVRKHLSVKSTQINSCC